VAGRPEILLADEPVSALDVSVRAQVLELLDRLVAEYGLTLVFITHDLSLVRALCHRIVIMKDGRIVEQGETEAIFDHPAEAYTQALLSAALE